MRLDEVVDMAIRQAARSSYHYRHGCVILSGKRVISAGHNDVRHRYGMVSVHAEINALWKIYDSDIYDNKRAVVIRVNETGNLCNSRPCDACMRALKRHGVRNVVYSTSGGNLEMEVIQ